MARSTEKKKRRQRSTKAEATQREQAARKAAVRAVRADSGRADDLHWEKLDGWTREEGLEAAVEGAVEIILADDPGAVEATEQMRWHALLVFNMAWIAELNGEAVSQADAEAVREATRVLGALDDWNPDELITADAAVGHQLFFASVLMQRLACRVIEGNATQEELTRARHWVRAMLDVEPQGARYVRIERLLAEARQMDSASTSPGGMCRAVSWLRRCCIEVDKRFERLPAEKFKAKIDAGPSTEFVRSAAELCVEAGLARNIDTVMATSKAYKKRHGIRVKPKR